MSIARLLSSVVPAGGWNIANAAFDSASLNVSSQISANTVTGIYWRQDGTRFFLADQTDNRVYQYNVTVPWDLTTASYASQSFLTSSQTANLVGVSFKPDGTKMFAIDQAGVIYQYTVATPWVVNTSTYDTVSFSVATQVSRVAGFSIKDDGTAFWVVDEDIPDVVYQYSMTAWTISSAVYDAKSLSGLSGITGVQFGREGTRLYLLTSTGDTVDEYIVGTPYDISTATFNADFDISSEGTSPEGFFIRSDGKFFYVLNTRVVDQYTM